MTNTNPRKCPACGGKRARPKGTKNRFAILICGDCSSIFTGHVPRSADAENYDDYYSETNLSVPSFIKDRLRDILDGFEPFRVCGRLLDVGCGAGTILEVAREKGWTALGLEVSEPAVLHSREKGFDVFHGELSAAKYADDHFDVVTASEIVEHLSDPQSTLAEIARILRPGGLFWATTPSARSLSYRVLGLDWSILSPPEHLQIYSRKGLTRMLREAGFSRIKLRTFGLNPAEIVAHFRHKDTNVAGFSRVQSAYELNESLTKSPGRRMLKNAANQCLDIAKLGDSLKIFAQK